MCTLHLYRQYKCTLCICRMKSGLGKVFFSYLFIYTFTIIFRFLLFEIIISLIEYYYTTIIWYSLV